MTVREFLINIAILSTIMGVAALIEAAGAVVQVHPLSGGDVPIPVQPGALLPPAQPLQDANVIRVVPAVVSHSRRNEPRVRLIAVLPGNDEFVFVPRVPYASRIRRRAESMVFPCVWQPGTVGTRAVHQPVSSRS